MPCRSGNFQWGSEISGRLVGICVCFQQRQHQILETLPRCNTQQRRPRKRVLSIGRHLPCFQQGQDLPGIPTRHQRISKGSFDSLQLIEPRGNRQSNNIDSPGILNETVRTASNQKLHHSLLSRVDGLQQRDLCVSTGNTIGVRFAQQEMANNFRSSTHSNRCLQRGKAVAMNPHPSCCLCSVVQQSADHGPVLADYCLH
mmetsp:Transcript_7104/g.15170  ORF Transcript_7104/g.15170 Transcript_7104/m.15170 type:complete len:200 (+) Transcript_7104:339-938(+)